MLIHNGYPFIKERSCKRRISWHCRMKAALKCRARLSLLLETNKIDVTNGTHNHEPVMTRWPTGKLQAERLNQDYLEYLPKKTYKTKNFESKQDLSDVLGDHKIAFISSVKGTLQITVDGYPFTRHRVKDSTVYWRCVQFKSLGCKARLRARYDPSVPFENNYDTLDQKVEIRISRSPFIPKDISLIRTFDGKPLNTSGFEIIKQLASGHAFCELKRKRLRGFCVKCIKKCKNVNFKKLLPKIETYCPSCPNGEWICANCFDIEHVAAIKVEDSGAKLYKCLLRRNSLKLCYNGYDFVVSYISFTSTKWVCTQKKYDCKARLGFCLITGNVKWLNFEHNHVTLPIDQIFKNYELIATKTSTDKIQLSELGENVHFERNCHGNLNLILNKFPFTKKKKVLDSIYWECKDRKALKCPARINQDIETNRIAITKPNHNHEVVNKRRVSGQLKSDRVKMGLPAEYLKSKRDPVDANKKDK
ncbi:unnamed protein product [Diamesa tonsa]